MLRLLPLAHTLGFRHPSLELEDHEDLDTALLTEGSLPWMVDNPLFHVAVAGLWADA